MPEHKPLTRQKTPWVSNPGEVFHMEGTTAHVFHRPVGDGELRAIIGREPLGRDGELRWHVSISFIDRKGQPSRYPSWDEQVHCLREIGPAGVTWTMILPPDGDGYVSLHSTTFHWHEADDE